MENKKQLEKAISLHLKVNMLPYTGCLCSSVDRAPPSGGGCAGSTPVRDVFIVLQKMTSCLLHRGHFHKYHYNIPNSFIAFASFSAFASVISVSGMRSGPTSIPIKFIAFLTGIGFTSLNNASISGIAFN